MLLNRSYRRYAVHHRRFVKLGWRGGGYIEITDGVIEGERVVTSANFLIDAESNLKAALQGFAAADVPQAAATSGGAKSMEE